MKRIIPFPGAAAVRALAMSATLFMTGPARAQSGPGHAALIAGDLNYVAVPHATAFNSLPLTVMAWVNTSVTTGSQGLVNKYVAASLNGWNLFLLNGHVRAWCFVDFNRYVRGDADGLDGGFIADGRWHHLALVVDGSGGRIFVDGIQRASQPWTGTPGSPTTAQEMRIGSYPGGNAGFAGSIYLDDISVWNASLGSGPIQTSLNGGTTGLEGSRLAYYRCDEGNGVTVGDSAPLGGSNHGTWVGPAIFAPVLPSAQTVAAGAVSFTGATLNGIVNPNRSAISAGFEWGTTEEYGNTNVAIAFGGPGAASDVGFGLTLAGLTFDTTYHFRTFASSSSGLVFDAGRTFRTLNVVETLPASALALTSARLHGAVTTLGSNMSVWFEWGPTTNYGQVTPVQMAPGSSTAIPVSADIAGQFQGQTQHFRLVATNANGRANGADRSFDLPVFPGVAGVPPLRSSRYDPVAGNYVEFEPRARWDTSVSMTVEAWVYRLDAGRIETILSHDWPGSYWLGFAPKLRFYRGTNFAEVSTPVPAGKWTHVAVSYDGAIARFYINGQYEGARPLANTGAGKLRILRVGHNGVNEGGFSPVSIFSGNLDEIRLWSVARSEGEIRGGLSREVRGEPGLAAVFPRGGRIEEMTGLLGAGLPPVEHIFGMVPRDLVVPRAVIPPAADSSLDLEGEYLGAEQLVLRYPDDPVARDAVAYFVHTTNDLFVGVRGLRFEDEGWADTNATLGLFLDPAYARPALAGPTQFVVQATRSLSLPNPVLLNGDGGGGFFRCTTGGQPCMPNSLWDIASSVCDGELLPFCAEFRVSGALLGSFTDFDGVALGHFNYSPFGEQAFEPQDGFSDSPMTWLTMSYGEGSANVPRVRWSGRVFAGLAGTNQPMANYRVSLGTGSAGGSVLTDTNGQFTFDLPLPFNQSIFAQAELEAFGRYALARVSPSPAVGPPQFVSTNVLVGTNRVVFPGLSPGPGGIVSLPAVDFFVLPPSDAAGIVSATPSVPRCGLAVRQGGVGGLGEMVTISGTNLHAEMDYFLAPVSVSFPVTPEFWTLIPATNVVRTDVHSVRVQAPIVPEFVREYTNGVFIPSFTSQWRWVARDKWFRPGRVEYSYTGSFPIRRPPYPNIHGFHFDNRDADASFDEFLAGYGYSAYICLDPFGDCDVHVPDPLYWDLWFEVHKIIIDKSGGSCVGMAGTALELFNNLILPQDFDPLALAANGISESGFPGQYDTSNRGGRYTRPPRPKDIWAHIRKNHGAQTSAEYLIHLVSQLDVDVFSPSFGGDPVARLPELRAGTTAQAVCMVQGFEGGHCVSPYFVEGNFNGNPNQTRIWIYDNNVPCPIGASAIHPCVTGQFIDIDHSANAYRFPGNDWTGTALFTTPRRLYTETRTAPGLIDIATALATFVVVVAGGADAHLTTAAGAEWGWRTDGSFVNNFPGLRAVPILGSPTNLTRSIPLLVPISNAVPVVDIHERDTNGHIFHVAAGGTMLQIDVTRGNPGHSNRVRLGSVSNRLQSIRFTPQSAISNFTPRAGFVLGNRACAAFQWLGLSGEGGRAQEFRALKDRRAVEYCNETTRPTTHSLRIDAVDGGTSNSTCAIFGPFTVPTGAVHCVVLHDWPRTRQVRSELDLDADGTPDQVSIVTGVDIDLDGDGMPDAWEALHQLNPESDVCDDGPDFDLDGDGVSNLGEYLSGTDPRDPASALRLIPSILPDGRVRLAWRAVPGRRYEILYADELWHVFRPLTGAGFPRVAMGAEEVFEFVPSPGQTTRFYQLRLVP